MSALLSPSTGRNWNSLDLICFSWGHPFLLVLGCRATPSDKTQTEGFILVLYPFTPFPLPLEPYSWLPVWFLHMKSFLCSCIFCGVSKRGFMYKRIRSDCGNISFFQMILLFFYLRKVIVIGKVRNESNKGPSFSSGAENSSYF